MWSNRSCALVLFSLLMTQSAGLQRDIQIGSGALDAYRAHAAHDIIADEAQLSAGSLSGEQNEFLRELGRFASAEEAYSENLEALTDGESSSSSMRDGAKAKDSAADDDSAQLVESTNQSNENTPHKTHNNATASGAEDTPTKFKSVEYDERPAGTILDEFVTGKLSAGETGNMLPIFLTEPESVYVVKNRPAVLRCKAAHALQLHFKCSGSSQPPPSTHDKHVDPHTGVHLEEVSSTIHRDLVDEYFGKGPFKCECHAWSSRGVVRSQSATVSIAYIRKQFAKSPTSLKVEVGSRAELDCEPPSGFPEPKISWHKNNAAITGAGDPLHTVSATGTLTIAQVSLQDMANYTCSAENIAGKRTSDSAVLIVYVNGGWSSWSPWKECKCSGKASQGRKRTRTCTNPIPTNGGAQCSGPQIQKSPDCIACPEETQIITTDGFDVSTGGRRLGRWSHWGEWSECSTNCIQMRRRKCLTNFADDGGGPAGAVGGNGGVAAKSQHCSGKDIQTAECRGDHCHIGKDDFDWTLYLGLAFITAVCFAFGAALICCARRGIWANPHYNMARTALDSEYMQAVDKKEMRMHIEAINVSYDYPHAGNRFMTSEQTAGGAMSEHHYDVPNLAANYTNPIDELSVDYQTDTPDTSTADTSNSTYDITGKVSSHSGAKSILCEPVGCNGASLRLYNSEIMLYIPELAVGKSQKKHLSLMVLSDDNTRICMHSGGKSLLTCSTIVHCDPRQHSFLKPVILKIPHCLVEPDLWNVNIYHADNDHDDINVLWRKITVVGEETINTPVFVQLEATHVYIMTEQLGRFVVVADAKPCAPHISPSIKMKLIAFSQTTPSSPNCSLRIYVVKDFPNSRDCCTGVESQLGGTFMGESDVFAFHLNSWNLKIRVRAVATDSWEAAHAAAAEVYEHIIPYNHILSNNSILHCEFSIKRSAHLAFSVDFLQRADPAAKGDGSLDGGASSAGSGDGEQHSFLISSENQPSSNDGVGGEQRPPATTTISIDRQGNYVNDTTSLLSGSVQLSRPTKRLICAALDPPRSDERDWRLLARKLNTARYIAYFATKPSPTEQILNLWECRARSSSHNVVELLMTLRDMERQDVMDIVADALGPLWV